MLNLDRSMSVKKRSETRGGRGRNFGKFIEV